MLIVNAQVLHAAHELPVANRKVFWEFRDSSEEQGPGQVQRSENMEPMNIYTPRVLLCLYIINSNGRGGHEKFITEIVCRVIFPPWK